MSIWKSFLRVKEFWLSDTVWTDLRFPATRVRQGALNKPDFDYTNIGLLFPQNDTAEKIYITAQMDHSKKLDTNIHLHVHYIQSEATQPTFTAEYKFYNNGEAIPGSWTTVNTSDAQGSKGVFTYSSGSIMQIGAFPFIAPPSNEDVSASLDLIIYRNDNDVTGDILVKEIDVHYEINNMGSRDEYVK
jgi:hypothetical protein